MEELCILQQQLLLVKPLGDVSTGSNCSAAQSGFLRIRVFISSVAVTASCIQTHSLDSPLLRANDIGDEYASLLEEDNTQICFERTDILVWKAGKATAINLHQKWTLKRTVAKQNMISYSQYSRKRVFNKAERQQM